MVCSLQACAPSVLQSKGGQSEPVGKKSEQISEPSGTQSHAPFSVSYQLLSNRIDDKCEVLEHAFCYQSQLVITSLDDFNDNDWSLYFSHVSPVIEVNNPAFSVHHINGDFHVLTPTNKFSGFVAGQPVEIPIISEVMALSKSQIMPNMFMVRDGQAPELISNTVIQSDKNTGLEYLPHVSGFGMADHLFKRTPNDATLPATARSVFEQNAEFFQVINQDKARTRIIPSPLSSQLDSGVMLNLAHGVYIANTDFSEQVFSAGLDRLKMLGITQSELGVPVSVRKVEGIAAEGYRLMLSEQGITIEASRPAGAFYGFQTIAALVDTRDLHVPTGKINDAPRFGFRGMLLDIARNFKPKEMVFRLLDQMAAYKLNKLHLHLADDEGWRIEIPSLPELTEVGAYRCFDPTEYACLLPQLGAGPDKSSVSNGYYSVDDYKEILSYAKARHIQVIPSMDMPGHSRAAIKSMQVRHRRLLSEGKTADAERYRLWDDNDTTKYSSIQYYHDNTLNVCLPSTYTFVETVIDNVSSIHSDAGVPLSRYHIGADETAGAWVDSPACKAFINRHADISKPEQLSALFIERVANILDEKGIEVGGWSDGLGHTNPKKMPAVVQTNAWTPLFWGGAKVAHQQANLGWEVVLSTPDVLYFDFPYQATPDEPGYYWASRHTSTRKVFRFMPENLPGNALQYKDREDNPYVIDDTEFPLEQSRHYAGMQGQFWSEVTRTEAQTEYMIFPRLMALAERAWYHAEWELPYVAGKAQTYGDGDGVHSSFTTLQNEDWLEFASALTTREFTKLALAGVTFRMPVPGGIIEEGVLHINTAYPGLRTEYKKEGGQWQPYNAPVFVGTHPVEIRSALQAFSRTSRAISVPAANQD